MFCTGCGAEIPDDARFCGGCGKPVQAGAADGSGATTVMSAGAAHTEKKMSWWQIGLLVIVLGFFGMLALGAILGPETYADVAGAAARDCVRNKGDGNWTGSSGLTLEEYCKGVGAVRALEAEKRDHPEKF